MSRTLRSRDYRRSPIAPADVRVSDDHFELTGFKTGILVSSGKLSPPAHSPIRIVPGNETSRRRVNRPAAARRGGPDWRAFRTIPPGRDDGDRSRANLLR